MRWLATAMAGTLVAACAVTPVTPLPWAALGFTSDEAEPHTTLIPGAGTYAADPDGLGLTGPVAWGPVLCPDMTQSRSS